MSYTSMFNNVFFSGTLGKHFKINYLETFHFVVQLLLCYHNVRCVFVIKESNYKWIINEKKIFTLVKTATSVVINYEKDRLKYHWKVDATIALKEKVKRK